MKKVIIWGAGRIGRGFAAEIFLDGGYDLVFVDNDQDLVERMNQNREYTIYKLSGDKQEKTLISGYYAYTPENPEIEKAFDESAILAVAVFPGAFEHVARSIAGYLSKKAKRNPDSKLDIIILANMLHAGERLSQMLKNSLSEEMQLYFKNKVGISESIVVRMAVDPTPEMKEEDSLVVATNGYKNLYVDSTLFVGEKPDCPGLSYVDNFRSWETRKLYTYNMLHALFAYVGIHKGHQYVFDCTKDADIMKIAQGAMDEVGLALRKGFGFSAEDMAKWSEECFHNMQNPYLNDALTRVGGDPKRKLQAGDRLSGAAVLCKTNGVMPFWLTKAIAYAFLYDVDGDAAALEIQCDIKLIGIKAAVRKYCGFDDEFELAQLVADRYKEAQTDPLGSIVENEERVQRYKSSWKAGFESELVYKGCGQCTLLAVRDIYHIFNEKVFEAATAFSGGMSLCGDGVCGGYAGGLMAIGLVAARSLDDLATKNKTGQYRAYELSAELHDLFEECYGTVICRDIHQCIFGTEYILREKPVRDAFEEAGAHTDKCTTVIAMAMYMLVQVFEKNDIYNRERGEA